jgi:hypothetical protein
MEPSFSEPAGVAFRAPETTVENPYNWGGHPFSVAGVVVLASLQVTTKVTPMS